MANGKRRSDQARSPASRKREAAVTSPNQEPANDKLEAELAGKLGEVLSRDEAEKALTVVHEVVASSYSGPLPPPAVLERYNEIAPGSADRIIAMAEKEQQQRHGWDNGLLATERRYATLGLLAGWTTAVALAAGAALAGIFGDWRVGVALAAASATGMVWKLVEGRSAARDGDEPAPAQSEKGRPARGRRKGR